MQAAPSRRARSGNAEDRVRDIWARLQGVYLYLIKYRALRKPAPHELNPKTAARVLVASVRGFAKAASSPYVIDKFIKCAETNLD